MQFLSRQLDRTFEVLFVRYPDRPFAGWAGGSLKTQSNSDAVQSSRRINRALNSLRGDRWGGVFRRHFISIGLVGAADVARSPAAAPDGRLSVAIPRGA